PPVAHADVAPLGAALGVTFLGFTADAGPEFWRAGNDGSLVQLSSAHLTGTSVPSVDPVASFKGSVYFNALDPATDENQIWNMAADGSLSQLPHLNSDYGGITVDSFFAADVALYFHTPLYDPSHDFAGGLFKIDAAGGVTQIT